jgi:hypothetical protein
METRADRYRRMGADDKLRAARTNDPSQKGAFEEAARQWLKLADEVERTDRNRMVLCRPPTNRTNEPLHAIRVELARAENPVLTATVSLSRAETLYSRA